ncbi:MAG: S1 RNA-binding domain-containing protein, partial [Hyphomonadaceae bacterium]|nr:S1 RNA-binding domain-containing protein [Hyphomonadaceae bacterium]
FGAKDGLVHVSQLARERVEKPGDIVKEGDTVKVKLLGFDDRGKVRLSMKVVDQATGADLTEELGDEAKDEGPRRDRGDRPRGDRGPRRDRGDRPRRESSGD